MKTIKLHDSFYLPWKLFFGCPQCVIEWSTLDIDTGRALDTRLNLFVDNILVVFTNGYAAHCAIICIGCLLVDCWRSVEVVDISSSLDLLWTQRPVQVLQMVSYPEIEQ